MLIFEDENLVIKTVNYLKQNRVESDNLYDFRLNKLFISYGSLEMKDINFELVAFLDNKMDEINASLVETDLNITLDVECLNTNFTNAKIEISSQRIKKEYLKGYVIYTFVDGYQGILSDYKQIK